MTGGGFATSLSKIAFTQIELVGDARYSWKWIFISYSERISWLEEDEIGGGVWGLMLAVFMHNDWTMNTNILEIMVFGEFA